MKFKNVSLIDYAYTEPENFITSEDIENNLSVVYDKLKLPHGRLELQTGIKTRGEWPLLTRPSTIAALSGQKIIKRNGADIDLLIHASVCRDFLEPSTASYVHSLLGLKESTQIFDLSNACLGLLNAVVVAAGLIESGLIKNALIVSGENSAPLLKETIEFLNRDQDLTRKSIKKYFANLTIGSGSVAFLVGDSRIYKDKPQIHSAIIKTNSDANKLCVGSGSNSSLMMQTESEELLHAGVLLAKNTYEDFIAQNKNAVDKIITHQVGVQHQKFLFDSLHLDISKDYSIFSRYGNTGTVAVPLTLIKAVEAQFIKPNDEILLMGIGSGLSSIMMGVKWV